MTPETREHARWGSLVPIVGIRVLSAITQKGWTVARTAREIGVPQQTLNSIVQGKRCQCRRSTRDALTNLLLVSQTWLSGGPPLETYGNNAELQLQLMCCSIRAARFHAALQLVFTSGEVQPDELNEVLSAALSLEEAIAKMYAASGVAPSRSAAGG